MADHLTGQTTLEDAILEIARDTRRYAKRQMTWFRKEKEIHWVESPSTHLEAICSDTNSFLSNEKMKLAWEVEVT
jgi:tRNA dimethylallyltransferase